MSSLNCQSSQRPRIKRHNLVTAAPSRTVDAAIVGGGIAGLWIYNALRRQGYSAVLFEADALGCDQTLASQGMIHGGLKYALSGALTQASEAIAQMPKRWQACLDGDLNAAGDVSLAGVPIQSQHYYMFAERSGIGSLTSFFASKTLRGRIDKVAQANWPDSLQGLRGVVYQLNDFVMDTRSLLQHLANQYPDGIYRHSISQQNTEKRADGYLIQTGESGTDSLLADTLICCAGNGSVPLIKEFGIQLAVQQRPLKQVIVHTTHHQPLYAHCLTGVASAEPRLTITTDHRDGHSVWYLGGKLATSGVNRSDAEQISFAKQELQRCLGWLDWDNAQYQTLWVNRAEPAQASGLRPDNAYVGRDGHFLLCFPTKLTLTPDLADQVLAQLPPPKHPTLEALDLPSVRIGDSPWQIN